VGVAEAGKVYDRCASITRGGTSLNTETRGKYAGLIAVNPLAVVFGFVAVFWYLIISNRDWRVALQR